MLCNLFIFMSFALLSKSVQSLNFNFLKAPFASGSGLQSSKYPILCDESVMRPKAHGTSEKPVQQNLRWNCDVKTADRICNFNRHYAGIE